MPFYLTQAGPGSKLEQTVDMHHFHSGACELATVCLKKGLFTARSLTRSNPVMLKCLLSHEFQVIQ